VSAATPHGGAGPATGQAGLLDYPAGPGPRPSCGSSLGRFPEEVTFVYGHTHKPFTDRWSVPGFPGPGSTSPTPEGWVVDTPPRRPRVQAGAAVLVNDDLDGRLTAVLPAKPPERRPAPVQLLPTPGRQSAVGLAHRAGLQDRPGRGAVVGAVGVRPPKLVAQRHTGCTPPDRGPLAATLNALTGP